MSRQPTTQVVNSTDQQFLIDLQQEVTQYRGLKSNLYHGQLVIHLMDSDKHWRKRNKKKKKPEYDDDYDGNYPV